MKNEKGFSLIELIVIIAIMAILGTFIFFSLSFASGQDARECANNLSTVLDKEKTYALTKSAETDCYVEISLGTDGYFAEFFIPKSATVRPTDPDPYISAEEKQIGKRAVVITCTFSDGTTATITAGHPMTVTYDRVTGAVKEVSVGTISGVCESITITHGRTYSITLYSATGKHELTRIH